MTINWVWIPNVSLGPILLGSSVKNYVNTLGAIRSEEAGDSTGWESYVIHDYDVYIDVSTGKVVSATAYSDFIYEDTNIIGSTIQQLNRILNHSAFEVGDPIEFDDGDVKISYDYFELGLQVWSSDTAVTSATCLNYSHRDQHI